MAKSRRGPAPVPGDPVSIRIESCPSAEKAIVRFLGQYMGTVSHFIKVGVRPAPCVGEDCPASLHKTRKQWKGYAPALIWRGGEYQDWSPCVWEVTETLNECLDELHLRGSEWHIQRKLGDTGKMEVQGVFTKEVTESELIAAFDVFPMVSRMYGYLPMQWGVKCHIPKRLRLEPVKASPPQGVTELNTTTAREGSKKPQYDQRTVLLMKEAKDHIFPGDPHSSFEKDGTPRSNGKVAHS